MIESWLNEDHTQGGARLFQTVVPWAYPQEAKVVADQIKQMYPASIHLQEQRQFPEDPILVTHWREREADYYFIVNPVEQTFEDVRVTFSAHVQGTPVRCDLIDGRIEHVQHALSRNGTEVKLTLQPLESMIVAFGHSMQISNKNNKRIPVQTLASDREYRLLNDDNH